MEFGELETHRFYTEDWEKFSISIEDLVNRPIISSDRDYEWENKMTYAEVRNFIFEAEEMARRQGKPVDWLTLFINRTILYNIFKLANDSVQTISNP